MKEKKFSLGALFFVCFWSLITLIFDGMLVVNGYRQVKAESYPVVEGRITHSEVTEHHSDDDGTTYGVDVRYKYRVGEREYECDRYRYGQMSSSDNSAEEIVESLPVDCVVDVHYNPADPADALLKVGLEGTDFFMALFMVPFNVIMLGGWAMLVSMFFGRPDSDAGGSAEILRRGFRTIVQRSTLPPIATALIAVGALAFVLIFVIGFGFGFNPPVAAMKAVWGAVLGIGFVVYSWSRTAGASRKRCLEIDETRRTLTLPARSGQNAPIIVSVGDVEDVVVEAGEPNDRSSVTLVYNDINGTQARHGIMQTANRHDADQLTAWLKKELEKRGHH